MLQLNHWIAVNYRVILESSCCVRSAILKMVEIRNFTETFVSLLGCLRIDALSIDSHEQTQ